MSGMSSLKTQTVQKTNITVYIADMDVAEQVKIEQELPLIYKDGLEGYDLGSLIELTMDVYDLDDQYGIQVDYWS